MAISEHLQRFAGLPVRDFDLAKGIADPTGTVYRVAAKDWTSSKQKGILQHLGAFLMDSRAAQVPALVIGCWDYEGRGSGQVVADLVAGRDKLPKLRSLFLGDIVFEEQEISWINQSDLSPLFPAFPQLEELWTRGGNELRFGRIEHERLQALAVQSGGLSADVVRDIAASELPALQHLELWMGVDEYGGNTTLDDLRPILSGENFPALVSLALRDCNWADDLAAAVVRSPIVRRLKVLDLSDGTLSDDGARALLELPVYGGQLERLDIHHHYVSGGVIAELRKLPFALDANEAEPDPGPGERYVAHAE